jgi:2'-5' RNA ligase
MPLAQIRSFIAVSLSREVKGELAGLQAKLKNPPKPWVKWVDPESIHITLKFLGDTPFDKIEAVKAAMAGAVQGLSPFKLKAGGLGVFPNPARAQVIWVGLTGDTTKLAELQQRLEKKLETNGFPAENRKFSAHLTLGRLRREALPEQQQEIGRLAESTECCLNSEISVESICLMKSQLTPQGPIYTSLAEVPLNID